jgi:hypothetical protein
MLSDSIRLPALVLSGGDVVLMMAAPCCNPAAFCTRDYAHIIAYVPISFSQQTRRGRRAKQKRNT